MAQGDVRRLLSMSHGAPSEPAELAHRVTDVLVRRGFSKQVLIKAARLAVRQHFPSFCPRASSARVDKAADARTHKRPFASTKESPPKNRAMHLALSEALAKRKGKNA